LALDFKPSGMSMNKHDRKSAREDIFAAFPRGLAVLELANPSDISTWRLVEINASASTLVPPSIETFLSGALLRLVPIVDLPALYREVLFTRRPRMIGIAQVEAGWQTDGPQGNFRRSH